MTLVLALKCKDALVMASDGQSTEMGGEQPLRSTADKIFGVGSCAIWGGCGDGGAIQEIRAALESVGASKLGDHRSLRQRFVEIVVAVNKPRYDRFKAMGLPNTAPPIAKVLFAQFEGSTPRIVEVAENGGATNYEESGYQAIGSGSIFARSSLLGYKTTVLTLDQAETLGYMTVEKAIDIAAFGLGYPIDIWTLRKISGEAKIERLSEDVKKTLSDTVATIIEAQMQVFMAESTKPAK